MARRHRIDRNNIRYWQFRGGYAQATEATLRAVLEGYRLKRFGRRELRVFAARLEQSALHEGSPVDLYRIVNHRSRLRGIRRLSQGQIEAAAATLDEHLPELRAGFEQEMSRARVAEQKPVARRALQQIASGKTTTVESLLLLAYFMRRIPQRKRYQRLVEGEHYARFRYAEFEAWTGVRRETQSRTIGRLSGFIARVPVGKREQRRLGQVFVDGQTLSLVLHLQLARPERQQAADRPHKKSTDAEPIVNAPRHEKSTLYKNVNPRTGNRKASSLVQWSETSWLTRHRDPDLRRIALRAQQESELLLEQAA